MDHHRTKHLRNSHPHHRNPRHHLFFQPPLPPHPRHLPFRPPPSDTNPYPPHHHHLQHPPPPPPPPPQLQSHLSHPPPPFRLRHHEVNFFNSPPRLYDRLRFDEEIPDIVHRPPIDPSFSPRVPVYDNHHRDFGNRRFDCREPVPPPPPPPVHRIPPPLSPIQLRQGKFPDCVSPPPFVDVDSFRPGFCGSPARFREDWGRVIDTDYRNHDRIVERDEFHGGRVEDERRTMIMRMKEIDAERKGREELRRGPIQDDRRTMDVAERDRLRLERLEDGRMMMDVVERDRLHLERVEVERRMVDVMERDALHREQDDVDRRFVDDLERAGLDHEQIDGERRMDVFQSDRLQVDRNHDDRRLRDVNELRMDDGRGVMDRVETDRLHHEQISDVRRRMDGTDWTARRILKDHERYELNHEPYHPEMVTGEFDLGPCSNGSARGKVGNDAPIREDLGLHNVRHRGSDMRRNSSHSPMRLRSRGSKFVESHEEKSNRGSIVDRGRREKEGLREEARDHTPSKNSLPKKSVFNRLQPAIQHTSSFRNRLENTTPSPHKGKDSKVVETVDRRLNKERVRSPMELDVSFKSNTLVAKAIATPPSSSRVHINENATMSDLVSMLDRKNLPTVECAENHKNDSSVSIKEDKQPVVKAKVSPVKKAGVRRKVVCVKSSESSTSSTSKLSGHGISCKASPKDQDFSRDDKNAGSQKVVVRKLRKVVSNLSRLSNTIQVNTNTGADDDHLSVDSLSEDKFVEHSVKELHSDCNVNSLTKDNEDLDMGKIDLNQLPTSAGNMEVMVCNVSEEPLCKKRKTVYLESDSSDSGKTGALGHRRVLDGHKVLNTDEDASKMVDICGSDIYTKRGCDHDQKLPTFLVDNGCMDEPSEPLVMLETTDHIDVVCRNMEDFVSVSGSIKSSSVVMEENMTDLAFPSLNVAVPCRLPSENDVFGQVFGDLHGDDKAADICVSGDVVSTSSRKVASESGVKDTNDMQELQFSSVGTMLVIDKAIERREQSPKTSVPTRDDMPLASFREVPSPLDRMKKAMIELHALDSAIPKGSHQKVTGCMDDNMEIPAEKHGPAFSDSPYCISESDCQLQDGLISSGIDCPVANDGSSFRVNKRKILTMESVSVDKVANATPDGHCLAVGTTLVNDAAGERKGQSLKNSVTLGGDLASSSVAVEISLLDRKKKAPVEPGPFDTGSSQISHNMDVGMSVSKKDLKLLGEKQSLVAISPSHCIMESAVSCGSCFVPSSVVGMMDHICTSGSCKKRKILPLVSEGCDLSTANVSVSIAGEPAKTVKFLATSVKGSGISCSSLPCKDANQSNGLQTIRCSFVDSSNGDNLQAVSHLSVEEIAPPCGKQYSCMSDSECKSKEDMDPNEARNSFGNDLFVFKSEYELAKNEENSDVSFIQNHRTADSNGALAVDRECESNISVEGDLGFMSTCPSLCPESTSAVLTANPAILDTQSGLGSLGACFPVTSSLDISVLATHANSDDKLCGVDKKSSQPLKLQGVYPSIGPKRNCFNLKPSAVLVDQHISQEPTLLPTMHGKKAVPSIFMSGKLKGRSVPTVGETFSSSSRVFPVPTSNKEVSTFSANPRTWRRTSRPVASNTILKKPSSIPIAPPQKQPYKKPLKVQDTSYIRKGNSLVRNPTSNATTLGSHSFGVSTIQSKANEANGTKKLKSSETTNIAELPDHLMTKGQHSALEILKPSSYSNVKVSDCDIACAGECMLSTQADPEKTEDALRPSEVALELSWNSDIFSNKKSEDDGTLSDGVVVATNMNRAFYLKRRSDQLIVTSPPSEPSAHNKEQTPALSSDNNYYKRRKNQLIRASSEGNIPKMVDNSAKSLPQMTQNVHYNRNSAKRLSRKGKSAKVSLVWKLGDSKQSSRGVESLNSKKLLSYLLPWKRATYWRSVWQQAASFPTFSSKIRKLLSSRKRAAMYVRSGRGFSLKRSKVISLAGSLKWSQSMEKHSKKVEEEAALAVAALDSSQGQEAFGSGASSESRNRKLSSHKSAHGMKRHRGERIFRVGVFRYRMDPSRRTLQRIPDEEALESTNSKPEKDAIKSYVPKRLLIGSNEYVRIGNGNQLVRDPKRRTRILASEKVRWSLHTARMRLAKKRKFCQFFTRCGTCNKAEGKCPYIHDPSKIAVCTKFLNGLCAHPDCKLTHKVIPDRMPDCLFFLQGLCSKEKCPYRHVNVNPKASRCENFIRGFCAEGNECRKKHSYSCPKFEATDSCPQRSKCKRYHPKKTVGTKEKNLNDEKNGKGRYFFSGPNTSVIEPGSVMSGKDARPTNDLVSQGGDLGDFISLDFSDDETGE